MAPFLLLNLPNKSEHQLGNPYPSGLIKTDSPKSRCIVLVELPIGLVSTLHRPINKPTIIGGKVSSILLILASARCSRPIRKSGRVHIAYVLAVALALPIVLNVPGLGKLQDFNPTEILPNQISPSEAPAKA